MKAEVYYRESYPKEVRIQLENEDELKFFKLLFSLTPKGILGKFDEDDLSRQHLNKRWKSRFIKKSDEANGDESPYTTYGVYQELENEMENIEMLEKSTVS
jgi:hypothetical protein